MKTHSVHTENPSAEPFAFALVQWPALIGVLAFDDTGWLLAARIALGAWLALTVLAAYSGRRGVAFGNTMLLLLACVAGAWWAYPGAWVLAWLAPLLIGLHAAQRTRLRPTQAADSGASARDTVCRTVQEDAMVRSLDQPQMAEHAVAHRGFADGT